jgi:hypothetical protein
MYTNYPYDLKLVTVQDQSCLCDTIIIIIIIIIIITIIIIIIIIKNWI